MNEVKQKVFHHKSFYLYVTDLVSLAGLLLSLVAFFCITSSSETMSSPSVSLESVFRLFLTTPFSSWSSIPSSAEVMLSLKKASFLLIGVLPLNAGNCGNSIDELFGHGSELVDTSMPLDISENVVAVEFSVAYGAKKILKRISKE